MELFLLNIEFILSAIQPSAREHCSPRVAAVARSLAQIGFL
jgi:hypothetical protein